MKYKPSNKTTQQINNWPYSSVGYYVAYNAHMDKNKFIKLAGSQVELGRILGINQSAISQWKTVPQARIWQLKVLKPEWFVDWRLQMCII